MRLGIFARTFARPTLEATLDAVRQHGFLCMQFNMACAGLPSLPDAIDEALCSRIRQACADRGLEMLAVSGTYNLIHPDLAYRAQNLGRFRVLAHSARAMGTSVVTICTGTQDPNDMWRCHPENDSPAAWKAMIAGLHNLVRIADEADILLGIEPETANVVSSAARARRVIDEIGSARLKIVLDAANLFDVANLTSMRRVLDEAFALLGPEIILAHAKDVSSDGRHVPAGKGVLDYGYYLKCLRAASPQCPLILHSLAEDEVPGCLQFLNRHLCAMAGS